MSSFSSINTALSGLLSHRRALDVIGHNIANAATDGFSRRRVDLSPAGNWAMPSMFSTPPANGTGVKVDGITRIRDEFLEARALREHGTLGRLGAEASVLGRLELSVPEPSDVGFAAQLGDFYAAWDDVANNPGDSAGRIAVLQQASTIASSLHRISAEMRGMRTSALSESVTMVAEINATAARIAELNGAVSRAVAAGLDAHDLADQRDRLVVSLATLAGVEVRAGEFGSVDVTLGGTSLVRGAKAEQLKVAEPEPLGGAYAGTGLDRVQIQWATDGYPANVTDGHLGGLLRNLDEHIPRAISELDAVAGALVGSVNALHLGGQGLDAVNDVGLHFWDPAGTTAATIRISTDVADQPSRIAAANAGSGALDAGVAQRIAALHNSSTGADAIYQDMIGRLAVETQAATRRVDIQSEVTYQADDARLSVSGVNLDEELASLITTQRSYEAAARLLTTIDQALDTLINRTGLVGR